MTSPTLRHLNRRLDYWLTVLDAPEWRGKIRLHWGRKREMGDAVGLCVWCPEYATADIALLRGSADLEETVVHEVLHVVLEGHREETVEYSPMYERGLNRIAAGLMTLSRKESRN